MVRIIEHRSALPNGPVVCVHVRHDPTADPSVYAQVAVEVFGQNPVPDAFPERLPVEDAFIDALAFAERASIPVLWIDDPGRHFPPDKRPVRDIAEQQGHSR
jgi:hypothetical protein